MYNVINPKESLTTSVFITTGKSPLDKSIVIYCKNVPMYFFKPHFFQCYERNEVFESPILVARKCNGAMYENYDKLPHPRPLYNLLI